VRFAHFIFLQQARLKTGRLVQAIRFADDQEMTASSEEGLQRMVEALERISEEYGMRINLKKTKVMMFTNGQPRKVLIWLRNTELEQVQEFCYLGSLLTEDVRCDKEIKKRIAMAKAAFMRRGELLGGNTSKDLKKRMVKALVWSVALYGSETWILRKEDIKLSRCRSGARWKRSAGQHMCQMNKS